MKKYFKYLLLIFILFFTFELNVFANTKTYERTNDNLRVPKSVIVNSNNYNDIISTPSVSSNEKVYDFSNKLTDKQKTKILKSINDYNKSSKYEAVIVITDNLNGKDISKYAYDFYDYNDFKKDGVIFVIYTGSNDPTIYMGNSGVENSKIFDIYNSAMINSTMKYLYDNSIKKGNYYEACINFVKIINGFYNKDVMGEYKVDENGNIVKTIPIVEIIIIALAITFIVDVLLIARFKFKKNNTLDILDSKVDKNTMVIRSEYDRLTDSTIK